MVPSTGTYSWVPQGPTILAAHCFHVSLTLRLLLSDSAFTDRTQKDLLKLIGNIPVCYDGESQLGPHKEGEKFSQFKVLITALSLFPGRSYNFPVLLWLMDSFPFTPPICFLRPTSSMVIREGKHVDARGRIFLPGLHNWDYVGFIEQCIWWRNESVRPVDATLILLLR